MRWLRGDAVTLVLIGHCPYGHGKLTPDPRTEVQWCLPCSLLDDEPVGYWSVPCGDGFGWSDTSSNIQPRLIGEPHNGGRY